MPRTFQREQSQACRQENESLVIPMRANTDTRSVNTSPFGMVGVEGNLILQHYEEWSDGHRIFKTLGRKSELTCESRFLYDATSFSTGGKQEI